jgi:hypothetical protein
MKLGLAGAVEYDDNIFRSDSNKKDDVVFRITPKIRFIEDEGKFHWDLSYRVPWEKAVMTSRVDGFSHLLNADASHQISEQTRAFLTNRFTYSDSVNRFTTIDEAGATPTVGTFRSPVTRNNATLGVQHSFTPRLMGNLAFSHRLFETDLANRSDNMVYVGNTNLQYALDTRHKIGGGAALTFQDFEASNNGRAPASQTLFFNMYASWSWALDETTSFSITGGPTYVNTDYDAAPVIITGQPLVPYFEDLSTGIVYVNQVTDCDPEGTIPADSLLGLCPGYAELDPNIDPEAPDPGLEAARAAAAQADIDTIKAADAVDLMSLNGGGSGSSTWTFFGEVSLNRRWTPTLVSSLTYRRTDSTASGIGSATLDLVSLVTTWQLSELWKLQVRGDFTHRESVTPSQQYLTVVDDAGPGGEEIDLTSNPSYELAHSNAYTVRTVENNLDTDRWSVGMRMERRLTKHIRASLRYRYNEQTSSYDTAGSRSDFGNHLVTLGVQYDFDRWHLW